MKRITFISIILLLILIIASCAAPQITKEDPVATPTTQHNENTHTNTAQAPEPIPEPTPEPTPEPIRILTLEDFNFDNAKTLIIAEERTVYETDYFILTIPKGVVYTTETIDTFNYIMKTMEEFTGLSFITNNSPRKPIVKILDRLQYWGYASVDYIGVGESVLFAPQPTAIYTFVHEMAHMLHRNNYPNLFVWNTNSTAIIEGFAMLLTEIIQINIIRIDDFFGYTFTEGNELRRVISRMTEADFSKIMSSSSTTYDEYNINKISSSQNAHFFGYIFCRFIYEEYGWDGVIELMDRLSTGRRSTRVIETTKELFGIENFNETFANWIDNNLATYFVNTHHNNNNTRRNNISYEWGNPLIIENIYNFTPVITEARSGSDNTVIHTAAYFPPLTFRLENESILIDFREGYELINHYLLQDRVQDPLFHPLDIKPLLHHLTISTPEFINIFVYDDNDNILLLKEDTRSFTSNIYDIAYIVFQNTSDEPADVILQYLAASNVHFPPRSNFGTFVLGYFERCC
jgi:hypothetical protein